MSDDLDHHHEPLFSSFWPQLILLIGLLIWLGCQDFSLNTQRSNMSKEFQTAMPALNEAQNYKNRYIALMNDLNTTAQKDDAAKQIINAAIQAGLIHVQPNAGTNAVSAPAEPAK